MKRGTDDNKWDRIVETQEGFVYTRNWLTGSASITWGRNQWQGMPKRIVITHNNGGFNISVGPDGHDNTIEVWQHETNRVTTYEYHTSRIYKVSIKIPGVSVHTVSGDLTINGRFSRKLVDQRERDKPIDGEMIRELIDLWGSEYKYTFNDHRYRIIHDHQDLIRDSMYEHNSIHKVVPIEDMSTDKPPTKPPTKRTKTNRV